MEAFNTSKDVSPTPVPACMYWTIEDEYVYERDKLDGSSTITDIRQVQQLKNMCKSSDPVILFTAFANDSL